MLATVLAVALAPFLAALLYWPGRKAARWLWKRMPDSRLKRALFKDRSGGLINPPETVKRWDQ